MQDRWSHTTKVMALLGLLAVGGWVLVRFSEAIPAVIISLLLAYILSPPTRWIVRHTGLPRGAAVLIVYLIVLVLLVLAPILVSPSVASLASGVQFDMASITALAHDLSNYQVTLGPLQLQVGAVLLQSATGLQKLLSSLGPQALLSLFNVLSSLLWVVFVMVVTFWLIKDSHKLEKWFFEHLPKSYRHDVSRLLRELDAIWGSFFKGTLVLALIVGTLVGLAMWILGIQHVLLLAIFAGFMEFIPSLGPTLGAILATVVAFLGGSSWLPLEPWIIALIVLAVYILIFQFEQVYLYPRVVGRRVNLHPGVVFVGAVLGAMEFGLLGVLLAAPVLASARVLIRYVWRRLMDQAPFPEEDQAERLAIQWRGMLGGQPIQAVLFDLDGTLAETDEQIIQRILRLLGPVNRLFPENHAEVYVRRWVMRAEPLVAWVFSRLNALDLDDDMTAAARRIRLWLGYKPSRDLQPVAQAQETLQALQARYPLGLVTTRDKESTRRCLQRWGWEDLFDVVVAREDVRRLKPHPEPVFTAAQALGVEPERCVMVGDTLADVQAARAAGAVAVAVLTGFGSQEDLNEADITLPHVAALTTWL